MLTAPAIPARVSFGLDLTKPGQLEIRTTGDLLHGIANGAWQDAVERVRSLPPDSTEQTAAKKLLPFSTWAGVFSYRRNQSLREHSGQIGVDLDNLGEVKAVATIQTAVADGYCLAAFRSTRGEGVRLLFRIPPCSPAQHGEAFEQVAEHVRNTYGCEVDESGKDVSRASFVSFDRGLWVNPSAQVLPVILSVTHSGNRDTARCVSSPYAGQLAVTCWSWYGRHYASIAPTAGDTVKTHKNLLGLGKALALHAERIKEKLTPRLIDSAFESWWNEHEKQGVRLRGLRDEYRRELQTSIEGAQRKPWFKTAAEKWTRWTRHQDFPDSGKSPEKIMFAIRQHCAEAKSREFFIGGRDAGLVAGVSHSTAARTLLKLCEDCQIKKTKGRDLSYHAQEYRLLKP
jgi:VirE N-terminal domain